MHPGGRPTIMTPETISKLEEAFANGAADLEACFYAGIGKTTLYNYQNDNPEFVDRKEGLRAMVKYQARKNITESIRNGDLENSKWYAERKIRNEFATREEHTGAFGEPITIKIINYGDTVAPPISAP